MGCGNTKAQKEVAAEPTNVASEQYNTRTENPQQQQHQQQQQQQQQQYQQQEYQQQQQEYLRQQQQRQQSSAGLESRREPLQNSQRVSAYADDNSPESYRKPNYPQTFDKNAAYEDSSEAEVSSNQQSYRKPEYPQTFEKNAAYEDHYQASSNQQSANPTFRSNNSYEQSQRAQNLQLAEQSQNVANDPKTMKIPKDDAGTPHILFAFDFANKDFNFYNYKTNQWDLNNLGRSTEDCPKCPLFKYRIPGEEAEGIQFARYMSYIALSDEVIFIIGGYNSYYSCLEYNVVSNKFYAREPLKNFRNNPSLCRYGQYIYAVSGDLLDKFSTDVARYDTQRNEWVTLPELPSPQGFASVAVINGVKGSQPSEKNLKLAVLGGLSHKFPKTHTSILSLFSFDEQKWTSFDLSRFIEGKIPKFVHSPIVQTKEGDIVIFGTEGSRSVYNLDVFNMKLTTAGRLPNDESFNESMKSKEAFCYNDKILCLAYKLELKVYRGSLGANKWEVI